MSEFDDDFPRRPADQLRRIARYQQWLAAVLLAQLVLWGVVVVLRLLGVGFVPLGTGLRFPVILSVILGGVGGIYVFLVYWIIRGPVLALFMALAAVIPFFGVLVTVAVNGAALAVLRRHNVRVGFFGGAVEGDIEEDYAFDDDQDEGW